MTFKAIERKIFRIFYQVIKSRIYVGEMVIS